MCRTPSRRACFGGGIADETLQTVQPFAQRLAEDLKMQLGKRAKIEVVGATGIVMRTIHEPKKRTEAGLNAPPRASTCAIEDRFSFFCRRIGGGPVTLFRLRQASGSDVP